MTAHALRPVLRSFLASCLVALGGCSLLKGASPLSGSTANIDAAMVGIVGDGIAGESIAQLSDQDRRRALAAEFKALEFGTVGAPVSWRGREGSGEVVALAPFQVGSQNCRQVTHELTVRGEARRARGAACREPDGSWTPLS